LIEKLLSGEVIPRPFLKENKGPFSLLPSCEKEANLHNPKKIIRNIEFFNMFPIYDDRLKSNDSFFIKIGK